MSIRVSSGGFSGTGICIGGTGLGVKGSVIRATTANGPHGPGILYDDWDDSSDDNKEFRAFIVTAPSGGTLFVNEPGDFTFSDAPDGLYELVYRLDIDGVSQGNATETFIVGTVSVLSDFSPTYSIAGAVNADLIATYGVTAAVETDLASAYSVIGAVQADLAASYDIQSGQVLADFAAVYSVVGLVESDLTAAYGVAGEVQSDLVGVFGVANAVQTDGAFSYTIAGEVFANLTSSYGIGGTVTKDMVTVYYIGDAAVPRQTYKVQREYLVFKA